MGRGWARHHRKSAWSHGPVLATQLSHPANNADHSHVQLVVGLGNRLSSAQNLVQKGGYPKLTRRWAFCSGVSGVVGKNDLTVGPKW